MHCPLALPTDPGQVMGHDTGGWIGGAMSFLTSASDNDEIFYFGYGSLVNLQTLPEGAKAIPGVLRGYVREWRLAGETDYGGVCALTIRRDPSWNILGVMVEDRRKNLPALDRREARYDRIPLPEDSFFAEGGNARPSLATATGAIFAYRGSPIFVRWGDKDYPILLSYIDCILSGFYALWGPQGIAHFMETTRGWHVPVRNDRAAPLYPRAVAIAPDVQRLIDEALEQAGVVFL